MIRVSRPQAATVFRSAFIFAAAATLACSDLAELTEIDEPVSGTVQISTIACKYTHTDGFRNDYYIISYAGTASGSEGMLLQLSSPDFAAGTKYTASCGAWTPFTWGGGNPGCERKPGQPETITWSASSDLWIENQTFRQEAALWHSQTGTIAKQTRSIRCLS